MSILLYSRKDTGGLVVEAALAKAGAEYRLAEVADRSSQQTAADLAALNPMRQVPTMVLPDGAVLTESAAIVMHIADLYPAAGLAPPRGTPAHARFLRWTLFMATNLYETDLRYFYAERYTADPAGAEGVKAAAVLRMASGFAVIEAALAPFVAGQTLSIADAYLAMLMGWSPQPVASPRLQAVLAAVTADPDYGPVWRRHELA